MEEEHSRKRSLEETLRENLFSILRTLPEDKPTLERLKYQNINDIEIYLELRKEGDKYIQSIYVSTPNTEEVKPLGEGSELRKADISTKVLSFEETLALGIENNPDSGDGKFVKTTFGQILGLAAQKITDDKAKKEK